MDGLHRGRRDILRLAGALAAGKLIGAPTARAARGTTRALSLYATHSGERLRVEYCAGGKYQPDALHAVSRLLRDRRTDETHAIDPGLLDQLHRLSVELGTRGEYHVVCGYRSPHTNATEHRLRPGVALRSLHVEGRAVDVFLPDRDLAQLHAAALQLGAGGVGYYPSSNFVHLDTGPVRTW